MRQTLFRGDTETTRVAEKDKEEKEPGLLRLIFKWVGTGLLTLLLIAAVFFQAPWKIITLLAIILAACTLLPRQMRKWFWFSVGAGTLILIIWIFLPENDEGWRPYSFAEELAAFEAEYTIPDEENAAFAYDEIFETLDTDSNAPDFFARQERSSLSGPWLSKNHPETTEWLKGHQGTIEKLLQVVQKDHCRFLPVSANPVIHDKHIREFYKTRQCAFLLLSAANNDIAEDRIDEGIEKYLCVLKMAEHSCQQPTLADHTVAIGVEDKTLPLLNQFVIEGRTSDQQLRLLIESMGNVENEWKPDWTKMLNFEYLYAKNRICSAQYEMNEKGKTRISRNPMAAFVIADEQEAPTLTSLQRKLSKAKTIFNWFVIPATPQKAADIFERCFERYYAMAEPEFDWAQQPQNFYSLITKENFTRIRFNFKFYMNVITDMFEENYYGIHEVYMNNLTLRRGSRLLIAVKQYQNEHGDWPPNLDAMKSDAPAEAFIDPVTGNPLEYENHGERFLLYGETANVWPK